MIKNFIGVLLNRYKNILTRYKLCHTCANIEAVGTREDKKQERHRGGSALVKKTSLCRNRLFYVFQFLVFTKFFY